MKTIVVAAIVGIVIGIMVIWLGVYNVAANDKHLSITTNLLKLVRERSIETRSENLKVPDLQNVKLVKEGAEHYAEMCIECHLAPGMSETELHAGLYPQPPVFSNQDYNEKPENQFWVIKNGIKMTGMPAWYPAHTDEQIWGMVAFLQVANTLSKNDYQELSKPTGDGHNHSHGDNDNHDAEPGDDENDTSVEELSSPASSDDGHNHSH